MPSFGLSNAGIGKESKEFPTPRGEALAELMLLIQEKEEEDDD